MTTYENKQAKVVALALLKLLALRTASSLRASDSTATSSATLIVRTKVTNG